MTDASGPDGRIVYCDERRLIGRRFALVRVEREVPLLVAEGLAHRQRAWDRWS
jgi:hypothetical protein